jgi:hypothetical protein
MRNRSLQHRLAQLEQRAGIGAEPPPRLILKFADADEPSDWAQADGCVWNREADEAEEQFGRRVLAEMPERRDVPSLVLFFSTRTVPTSP